MRIFRYILLALSVYLFGLLAQKVQAQPISPDTNADTICSGTTTYLDGEGNCDDISSVYEPAGITESDISDLSHTTDTSCTLNACTVGTDDSVTLEQGTAPLNVTEGRIQWDTDDDRLVVGSGASVATFYSGAHTTDTSADTLCTGTNVYLDGDGNCDTLTIAADTNADTICTGTTTYLDGEGNCDTLDTTDDDLSNNSVADLSDVSLWQAWSTSSGCSGACTWSETPTSFRYFLVEDLLCFYIDGGSGNTPSANTGYLTLTMPATFLSQTGTVSMQFLAKLTIDSSETIVTTYLLDNTNELRIYADHAFGSFTTADNINAIQIHGCYEAT